MTNLSGDDFLDSYDGTTCIFLPYKISYAYGA